MTEKQINYLNKINSIFVGQKIKNVHYEVILYEDQEYWEFSNEIHSVDMNIILELDNDKFFKVLWDNEFECYGIGVYEINELKPADSFKLIKVSDNINWKSKIGKKITSINVFWLIIWQTVLVRRWKGSGPLFEQKRRSPGFPAAITAGQAVRATDRIRGDRDRTGSA